MSRSDMVNFIGYFVPRVLQHREESAFKLSEQLLSAAGQEQDPFGNGAALACREIFYEVRREVDLIRPVLDALFADKDNPLHSLLYAQVYTKARHIAESTLRLFTGISVEQWNTILSYAGQAGSRLADLAVDCPEDLNAVLEDIGSAEATAGPLPNGWFRSFDFKYAPATILECHSAAQLETALEQQSNQKVLCYIAWLLAWVVAATDLLIEELGSVVLLGQFEYGHDGYSRVRSKIATVVVQQPS